MPRNRQASEKQWSVHAVHLMQRLSPEKEKSYRQNGKVLEEYRTEFLEAMCDDLNTSKAIAVLFELTRKLNILDFADNEIVDVYHTLLFLGDMLGLLKKPADQWFKTPRIREDFSEKGALSDDDIEALIEQRYQARIDQNWSLADGIRDQLQAASIHLEDRDGKTVWRRK